MDARSARWPVVLVVLLPILAGCPRSPDDSTPQVIELEPMFFTILRKGDRTVVKDYDAEQIFAKAEELMREGRIAEARKLYQMVARDAAGTDAEGAAWFNLALCELAMERPGDALAALEKAQARGVSEPDMTRIRVLQVEALAGRGEWDKVRAEGELLVQGTLAPDWEAKVRLFLAAAAQNRDDLPEAETQARKAQRLLLSFLSLQAQHADNLVSQASFRLGEVFRAQFERLKLLMPVERMTLDMSDKLALLRQAEEHYLESVRVRSAAWSPRAGYQVAALYETFAFDTLNAEVPPDLDELELQVYTEELNLKVVPFLQKAVDIHRKNVAMCDTYRFSTPWQKRSETRAAELEAVVAKLARPAEDPGTGSR
jgi:tetratricopeptide (TPR) repeat protein